MRLFWALLAVLALCLPGSGTGPVGARPADGPSDDASRPPLLAYYYQWFNPGSWQRAKTDLPLAGAYSSDDARVIDRQITEAKAAGIDGFIVGWKHGTVNDRRLAKLVAAAEARDFKLAMIYQSLDFYRRPLPVAQVAADFDRFRDQFADSPAMLRVDGRPLTVWSGTWSYSHDDVARVTSAVRGELLVLASEKNVDGYRRIADVTDGDAYYWSSPDPETTPGYADKLADMARAVHADHKIWLAPCAPGFDARLVGGTKPVPRRNGATLAAEYSAALRSSPDAIGLISWNEFSENTHVEPSRDHGDHYLQVLRDLRGVPATVPSDDGTALSRNGHRRSVPESGTLPGLWAFVGLVAPMLLVTPLAVRRLRAGRPGPAPAGRTRAGTGPERAVSRSPGPSSRRCSRPDRAP
ncbi:endo-1,3-alpha-glucanase family glycosylhydrolase [Streptomyces sp. NPDC004266]|uniref:endo-1,3-alpha-glucanase family glycosylhydrolase n=1 Tax=Streptomyces sp. NPDC004266 TaxID=3364693 RepID=UPI0036767618